MKLILSQISRKLILMLALAGSLMSTEARAQVYFEETFLPVYIMQNTAREVLGGSHGEPVPTQSGFGYDFRTTLGYVFWNQMVVGLTYNYYKTNSTRSAVGDVSSVDETHVKNEFGPTLGYVTGGWRFLLTYFISGERTYSSIGKDSAGAPAEDTQLTRKKGSGFQFTVGYALPLSSSFFIGPSLVYRSVSYARGSRTNNLNSTETIAEEDLASAAVDAGLSPMISLIATF